jgi:hypothetical protein
MRRQPRDLHREVLRRDATRFSDDPGWYAVWLGPPHGEESVLLGRTERLPRPRHWRAFPVCGEYPRVLKPWTAAAAWLIEVHEGRDKTLDRGRVTEQEKVGVPGE